jgi:hypothetical protein
MSSEFQFIVCKHKTWMYSENYIETYVEIPLYQMDAHRLGFIKII